jgi:hypothetical protein
MTKRKKMYDYKERVKLPEGFGNIKNGPMMIQVKKHKVVGKIGY